MSSNCGFQLGYPIERLQGSIANTNKSYRLWQGCMRLVAGIALLCIMAPLFACIWIINQFGDRGPLFFKQKRPGLNGEPFEILKLRTMRIGSEKATELGTQNDNPQITRLGRILRKLKIDESPQLLNIVKGDMTIVGPRPIPMALDAELSDQIYGFHARYETLPGLTSIGQICINDNALGDELAADWRLRFEGELHYIRKQSISYDIRHDRLDELLRL